MAANNTAGITSDQLESATQALILAVDTFPKNDDVVQSKTDKMSQLRIIYSLLAAQVTGEEDEMIVFSNLLYAFCWSFGATLQDQVDVAKFDTVVRKVTKEVDVFAKVALLEKINILHQWTILLVIRLLCIFLAKIRVIKIKIPTKKQNRTRW